MTRTRAYLESWRERELQDIAIPGRIDTTAYILVGLAAAAYPPDPATDALARYVKRRQLADGSWHVASHRPPIESSDIAVTALSLRSLQAYRACAVEGRVRPRDPARRRMARASGTEEQRRSCIYRFSGLTWAGASRAASRTAANALIARQRADGGWGQIPTLSERRLRNRSGLTALAESGAVKPTDPPTKVVCDSCSGRSWMTARGTSGAARLRSSRTSTASSRTVRTSSSPRRRPIGPRSR